MKKILKSKRMAEKGKGMNVEKWGQRKMGSSLPLTLVDHFL